MSESTASVTRPALLREIGRLLGWNRDPANWSANQTTDGNDILLKGLRQFYSPPILPGEASSHSWSFLRPVADLVVVAGVWRYELPEDFGGFDGNVTYQGSESSAVTIEVTSDIRIRRERQWESNDVGTVGFPNKCAVLPIPSDGSAGQRWEVWFYPTPDREYELQYRYYSLPENITSDKPYPLGGQPHAETIIESCLAAAEMKMDDVKGLHWEEFMSRLAVSVSFDRKRFGPSTLGYNADSQGIRLHKHDQARYVTYNGVRYN